MLPVGEGDRLVGMLTDRDIAVRAVAKGKGPDAKVRDAMTADVKFCFDDEDLDDAVRSMGEQKVRRLPVMSRDKRLVGIVSLRRRGGLRRRQADRRGGERRLGAGRAAHPGRLRQGRAGAQGAPRPRRATGGGLGGRGRKRVGWLVSACGLPEPVPLLAVVWLIACLAVWSTPWLSAAPPSPPAAAARPEAAAARTSLAHVPSRSFDGSRPLNIPGRRGFPA